MKRTKKKDKLNWERIIGIVLMIGTFILWAYAVVSYDKAWGLFSKIVWSILCLIFIIDFSTWGKK